MTDSATMGAAVPRNTPKIENAVNTVKAAEQRAQEVHQDPAITTTTPHELQILEQQGTVACQEPTMSPQGSRAGRPNSDEALGQEAAHSESQQRPGPTSRVRRERRSGSRRWRHATNHSKPRPIPYHSRSGRMSGNRITSRIDG
jgi:hypothetical protein